MLIARMGKGETRAVVRIQLCKSKRWPGYRSVSDGGLRGDQVESVSAVIMMYFTSLFARSVVKVVWTANDLFSNSVGRSDSGLGSSFFLWTDMNLQLAA